MLVSEVLAKALEFWGEGGEQWVTGDIGTSHTACLVGGIGYAVTGHPCYYQHVEEDAEKAKAYRGAMACIYDELEARGLLGSDPYSDWDSPKYPDTLEDQLVEYNDTQADFKKDIKPIVCAALQRALVKEQADGE